MRRPGTNERDVKMSDVLCDFCHRAWSEDVPMVEGHRGSCVCGRCLAVAYGEVVLNGHDSAAGAYTCPLCLEADRDREALGRAGEPGWRSPVYDGAVICRRCIRLAAASLEKDRDSGWKRPDESDRNDVTA